MHPADETALAIALEEERRLEAQEPPRDRRPHRMHELVVINREDVTTSSAFHINEPGTTMPIEGQPGTLVQALVIIDSDQFDVFLEIDGRAVIDDAFSDIETISTELDRITAFQQAGGGDFVFSATDYEFLESVDCVIMPQQEVTVTRQRAEVDLVRDVFVT